MLLAWLADKTGRVRSMQVTCVICIISGAIQGGSIHIAMFLIGRFLSGIGVGLMVTLIPIYQSEVSPTESRGRMVGSHGFLIVTGYVCGRLSFLCSILPHLFANKFLFEPVTDLTSRLLQHGQVSVAIFLP